MASANFFHNQVEEHIRTEFRAAFARMEHATATEKEDAAVRLNHAVRRLYDFIGHGKVPADSHSTRETKIP